MKIFIIILKLSNKALLVEGLYDKEKYLELLLNAAETVLGYFGFDGSVYRKSENRGIRSNKQKKWWYELREERRKDVEAERDN